MKTAASKQTSDLLRSSVLAGAYFLMAKAGLALAYIHPNATAVWPPTGLAMAAVLLWGYRIWPGIAAGALLANLSTPGTAIFSAVGIALGNTLEALIAGALVNRFAGGNRFLERVRDVFRFALLAAVLSTTVSATAGILSLHQSSHPWSYYGTVWLTWWLGDAVGALVVTPWLVAWTRFPAGRWGLGALFEAGVLLVLLFVSALLAFQNWFRSPIPFYPMAYMVIPFVIWAAVRFGQPGATAAIVVLSGIAIANSLRGSAPLGNQTQNLVLLWSQAFLATVALTGLTLAAVTTAQHSAETALHASHRQIARILGRITDGFFALDSEWRLTYLNRHAQTISREMQKDPATILGRNLWEEFPMLNGTPFDTHLRRAVSEQNRDTFEFYFAPLRRWYAINVYPSPDGLSVYFQDITQLKLDQEQIRTSLREKEVLLSEVNHRVKNNLQVISSLLNLQAGRAPDAHVMELVRETQGRIKTMALVHERLYGSRNLSQLNFGQFIRDLATDIHRSFTHAGTPVQLQVQVPDVAVSLDTAIPCGLIIHELISNAHKHAFPAGRPGVIGIALTPAADQKYDLVVWDDGVGMAEPVCVGGAESLGLSLVHALADQLGATVQMQRSPGIRFSIQFRLDIRDNA